MIFSVRAVSQQRMLKVRGNIESWHSPRGGIGLGDHALKTYPVGLHMSNALNVENCDLALERWITDGGYAMFLPCAISLLTFNPLLLFSLLSAGNLEWVDQNVRHGARSSDPVWHGTYIEPKETVFSNSYILFTRYKKQAQTSFSKNKILKWGREIFFSLCC